MATGSSTGSRLFHSLRETPHANIASNQMVAQVMGEMDLPASSENKKRVEAALGEVVDQAVDDPRYLWVLRDKETGNFLHEMAGSGPGAGPRPRLAPAVGDRHRPRHAPGGHPPRAPPPAVPLTAGSSVGQ